MTPKEILRYHVTGAIERGEKEPIVERRPRVTGSHRVPKSDWYAAGGLENSRCWRRQRKTDGRWIYYMTNHN